MSLLLLALLMGCRSQRPVTVPVTGQITFDGGHCPARGRIDFMPLEPAAGFSRRPGSGAFDTDGTFTVMSFEAGDGLVPGRYQPSIECWKTLPDEATGAPGESYVPKGFESQELVVPADSRKPIQLNYDVARP